MIPIAKIEALARRLVRDVDEEDEDWEFAESLDRMFFDLRMEALQGADGPTDKCPYCRGECARDWYIGWGRPVRLLFCRRCRVVCDICDRDEATLYKENEYAQG